ncbi:hypothetical protein OIU77_006018 [Salix suchowensis]|uniref:COP1-interacting protein 7 n=1 Tax=Salix suchowensis TaxID=1278906 RepID=A0ABQ9AU47_9ROSI|nr:hypothetical protein OIU77_006018 [Salix suchowensis]
MISKERVEDRKDVVPRAEEQRIKTELKGSSKLKAGFPVTTQQQKKETALKNLSRTRRVDTNSKKRIDTEGVTPKNISRSQEQAAKNVGLGCKEDDKKSGYNCDFDPVSKVTSTKLAGQPSTGEAANVIKFHNEEHSNDSQRSPLQSYIVDLSTCGSCKIS